MAIYQQSYSKIYTELDGFLGSLECEKGAKQKCKQ